jgi:uncharacterized protein (TIGR03067 family)
MRSLLMIAVLVLAVPDREAPSSKPLQEQVVGEWESTKIISRGEELKDITLKIVVTPKEILAYQNGKHKVEEDAVYTIDARKTPATIDINPIRADQKKERAIFKIEGDQMIVCVILEEDGPRPTEFRAPPDSELTLVYFKRIKK